MSRSLKIVTIGGGSSYTPELIEGLIVRHQELPVGELWLVDVEAGQEKLEIITALTKRMIAKAGLDIKVYSTLNREEALPGADFVTTQFRVGQLDARINDEMIPAKHGMIGQETNGAGGLFKGLRTIPVIMEIISDCERLCPQAWTISFTNPAGMITEAVFRYTNWKKFIGLCNVPIGMEMAVGSMLEVDKKRLRMDFAGLNHMVFGLDVYVDGFSVKEKILAQMGQAASMTMRNIQDIPWSYSFLKGLGVIPCPYLRYYMQKDEMLAHILEEYGKGQCRGTIVKDVERDLFAKYADPDLAVKPKELELRGGAYYSDAACNLIASIYNDRQDIQVVNTRNNGAITSLPDEMAVEVSAVITKDGPRPLALGRLPITFEGLVWQIKSFELMAAKAALSGKYEDALVAMVTNPLVQSEKKGIAVLDEMLLANAQYLPRFAEAIREVEARHAADR
jgi:6-phospho-beta-glucosidase